jgi:rare lipoprotein A
MWKIVLIAFLLFLVACGPKQRVIIGKRIEPLPEKRSAEGGIDKSAHLEKRETREVQYGIASWYGGEFHGRPTSSGEVYDMFQLTCAHNSLPLGTMVMVTNLENGRSVELKVNDRGPFVKERIIDVSYAAARILGMWGKGTTRVKVEWVGSPLTELVERFHLQVGSFSDEARAKDLAERLKNSFENVYIATVETQTQRYHRVRLGPFDTKEAALPLAEQLTQMGFQVLVTNR